MFPTGTRLPPGPARTHPPGTGRPRPRPRRPRSRRASQISRAPGVFDDLDVLSNDQPLGNELIERRQERIDLVDPVDDDHDHRQVFGEAENASRVDPARRAEPLEAAHDRRPSQARVMRSLDDFHVERFMSVLVALPDEDRQPLTWSLQLHRLLLRRGGHSRPATIPRYTATPPVARLPSAYVSPSATWPSRNSKSVSTAYVENVV